MTPSFAANSKANCTLSNAILCGKRFLTNVAKRISRTNLNYERFVEFCQWLFAAAWLTGFANHIGAVIGGSTKKEMIGANAIRIITMMANSQPVRDRAICQFPSQTVRKAWFVVYDNSTAPKSILPAYPLPTAGNGVLVDLRPKPVSDRNGYVIVSANESARLTGNMPTPFVGALRNRCRLTATTFAEFNGRVMRGIIEGHSDLHSRCVKSQAARTALGHLIAYLHYTPTEQFSQGEVVA